jgi:2',3'-cyclic-nucleotide 2'-phosphodiesterase (5'-nucleotidase family)
MKIITLLFPILGLLSIPSCKLAFTAVEADPTLYTITESAKSVEEDSVLAEVNELEKLLKPYRDSLVQLVNVVIGETGADFKKEKPGGSLGNLIADAMFETARAYQPACHGSIFNYGGIRLPDIMRGPVTNGKLLELLPFDNELVILQIDGKTLEQWLNTIGQKGGWPISLPGLITMQENVIQFEEDHSNPNVNRSEETPDHKMPSGKIIFREGKLLTRYADTSYLERVDGTLNMKVLNFHIHPDSTYLIATNDYVANGGDNCEFLKAVPRDQLQKLIRDIVTTYIKNKKLILPDPQQRMLFQQAINPSYEKSKP